MCAFFRIMCYSTVDLQLKILFSLRNMFVSYKWVSGACAAVCEKTKSRLILRQDESSCQARWFGLAWQDDLGSPEPSRVVPRGPSFWTSPNCPKRIWWTDSKTNSIRNGFKIMQQWAEHNPKLIQTKWLQNQAPMFLKYLHSNPNTISKVSCQRSSVIPRWSHIYPNQISTSAQTYNNVRPILFQYDPKLIPQWYQRAIKMIPHPSCDMMIHNSSEIKSIIVEASRVIPEVSEWGSK